MTSLPKYGVDDFPCGCIVTDASRRVTFANRYVTTQFGWWFEEILGQRLEKLMSPASHLFCESYVYPMLLQTEKCEEILITFLTSGGTRIPVIASSRKTSENCIVWSVFCAENRDKLYQELVSTRDKLEEQARQLKVLSTVDDLTGLMNRRAFNEVATTFFSQAEQTGGAVSLLILDVDDFKKINDTYGHAFGDDVLRTVGTALTKTCRSRELVARFGGEEFVFALTDADAEGANVFAQRLHTAIKTAMKHLHPITVSIGVANRFGRHGPSYLELLSQADKALYVAKETGKNKTIIGGTMRFANHALTV
jgi:diguanylate cyclase (GGDEF)-like protein/PAS domain S-box-containing protein